MRKAFALEKWKIYSTFVLYNRSNICYNAPDRMEVGLAS